MARPYRLGGIDLGTEQQAVLDTRVKERITEHRTLQSRIEQRKVEVANLEKETKALEGMVAIRQQVFDDKANLLKQGLATRRDYFNDQYRYRAVQNPVVEFQWKARLCQRGPR